MLTERVTLVPIYYLSPLDSCPLLAELQESILAADV